MTISVEDPGDIIRLPAGLKEIGEGAFTNSGITAVMIPAAVTSIAEDAFEGCPDLVIYCYEGSSAHHYAMEKGIRFITIDFYTKSNYNSPKELSDTVYKALD